MSPPRSDGNRGASTGRNIEAPQGHDGDAVTSPMVGTVYLAPQPGDPPFVQPGDSVSAGDTLVIIEAMKLMNPIQAPARVR